MRVVCGESLGRSFLYIMTSHTVFNKAQVRKYLARIMSVLEEKYPDDKSIHDWEKILDWTLTGVWPEKMKPTGELKLR